MQRGCRRGRGIAAAGAVIVGSLIGALGLVACGGGSPAKPLPFVHPDSARLGAGTSDVDCNNLDSGGVEGLVHDDTTWVQVTHFSLTGPAAAPPDDESAPAEATLLEQLPGAITLDRGAIYFDIDQRTGKRLLDVASTDEVWLELRVTPAAALGARAVNALVIRDTGFAFVGICERGDTDAAATNLRRHVQTMDQVVVVLRSFMSHETGGVEQLLR